MIARFLAFLLFVPALLVIGAMGAWLIMRPQRGYLTGAWFV